MRCGLGAVECIKEEGLDGSMECAVWPAKSGWVSERRNGGMDEKMDEKMNERTNEQTNKQTNKRMSVCLYAVRLHWPPLPPDMPSSAMLPKVRREGKSTAHPLTFRIQCVCCNQSKHTQWPLIDFCSGLAGGRTKAFDQEETWV